MDAKCNRSNEARNQKFNSLISYVFLLRNICDVLVFTPPSFSVSWNDMENIAFYTHIEHKFQQRSGKKI